MLKRILVIGVVLAGLLAGTAQGAGVYVAKAPGRLTFERSPHLPTVKGKILLPTALRPALVAAQLYWGVEYPSHCFDALISYGTPTSAEGESVAGEATETVEPETACYMVVSATLTPEAQCQVVVHEFGHWRGFGHSANPADVMYEGGPWWAAIPECSG